MKKRFSEEQIVGFLKEAERGASVEDLCRRRGFSEAQRVTGCGMEDPADFCRKASADFGAEVYRKSTVEHEAGYSRAQGRLLVRPMVAI